VYSAALVAAQRGSAELVALCLMPSHCHMLVLPARERLSAWVGDWKALTTRSAWGTGHRGTLWRRGFWDRMSRGQSEVRATCIYIVRNPVRAGLCREPEDWPWSWLSPWWVG